ncbi:CIC11C00000000143 [Sungouiella intermedia]|uniref:ubiquitinyl hydrolase 1 n=1 Tax=Sungouiella intermedia TaxID=45354 RepID=A0A1L0BDB4_9ASCO|nr:CIC11C00000000143 [[Candida] intermedia]
MSSTPPTSKSTIDTSQSSTANGSSSTGSNTPSNGSNSSSNGSSTSSNGTAALGPRRFRGDVAPFSPAAQSPHIYSQQLHYPPQVPGQNMAYPQYYSQQPQFVYGGQSLPYYPVAMGYPDYMYQQYQYYAMANQYGTPLPYMNMGMNNGYAPRKKHSKSHYNHYDYNKSLWSPSASPAAETADEGQRDNQPAEYEEKEKHAKAEKAEKAEKVEKIEQEVKDVKDVRDPKGEEAPRDNLVNVEKADESTEKTGNVEQSQKVTSDKTPASSSNTGPLPNGNGLPLYFNTSIDEFKLNKKDAANKNEDRIASKSARVEAFLSLVAGDVAITPNAQTRIVDHNSDKAYFKRLYHTPQSANTYDNETNDSASAQKAPTSNWASFLQTTAKPAKKGSLPKPVGVAGVSQASAPTQPSKPTTPVSTTLPQPLGVLAMKMLFDPEFYLDDCDPYLIKPRGLTNSGNICYMNAILQCLVFCIPFSKVLKTIEDRSIGSIGENSPTPLIDATIQFINDFMNVPPLGKPNGSVVNSDGIVVGRPLSPEGLYMKLIENTKFQHLKWGQQEDAEEFLGYFLDGLHEEFVKVESTVAGSQMEKYYQEFSRNLDSSLAAELKTKMKEAVRLLSSPDQKHVEINEVDDDNSQPNGWSEVGSGKRVSKKRIVEVEPSPITQIFGGQFRSVLTVPKSKESQSITVDPFRCILVDISLGDIETIEDALWKFNEAEKLPYKIEAGREVVARKQTFIDELPDVLVLLLKRFSYQHEQGHNKENEDGSEQNEAEGMHAVGSIEKVMKNIKFGLDLSIPAECLSPGARTSQKRDYRLIAAIYHHGRNAEGGHYTCDVSRDKQSWLRIDDTAVEKIDASNVIEKPEAGDKSAYILMYERK